MSAQRKKIGTGTLTNTKKAVTSKPQSHVPVVLVTLLLTFDPCLDVAVKDCRRGSQPVESDFYSKPLKGQQVSEGALMG